MPAEVRGSAFSQRGSNKRLLLLAGILILVLIVAFGMRLKAAQQPPPVIRLTDTTPRGQGVPAEQRLRFCRNFQERFSKKFQGSKVVSGGDKDKTFRIEWSGVDRPFAAMITETDEIVNDLRELGFKRLIITDGHNSSWDVDLKN